MKKNILLLTMVIAAAIQFAIPVNGIRHHERILKEGERVLFECRPVDPLDIFRGRYVRINPNIGEVSFIEDIEKIQRGQPYYLRFSVNEESVASQFRASLKKPKSGPYLRLISNRYMAKPITFRPVTNFKRYYMNEKLAPAAETAYRDAQRENNAHVAIRILDGEGLIERILIDKTPIEDYLRELLLSEE